MFTLGEYYLRKKVHEAMGGGQEQHFLSQKDGQILVAFYDSATNPAGPQTIPVGKGDALLAKARLLAAQTEPIPVFRKADAKGANAGKFEYVGRYICTELVEPVAETIAADAANDIVSNYSPPVLKMQYVGP